METKQFQLPGKIKTIFLLYALSLVVACSFAQVNITGKASVKGGNQTVAEHHPSWY